MRLKRFTAVIGIVLACSALLIAQSKRYVIIDQDAAGPGGTDMQAILVLLQSPQTDVLGITVVTGDGWRDEEVQHALRLLELIGRTDVPVVPGAVYPLVRTPQGTELWEQRFGKVVYKGAWGSSRAHGPYEVPPMPEGTPTSKPSEEDAAHFMTRMVHKYPHQVTIFEGGPMTNLALAIRLDPQFAGLTEGLVFMGASINPQSSDPEFATNPSREFNLWFDPEAADIVLRAPWPSITATPVDVSIQTQLTQQMVDDIRRAKTPVAQYVARYAHPGTSYMWDELAAAAWLDPSLITKTDDLYMDVDLDRGASYGDTLLWPEKYRPADGVRLVHVQMKVDARRFEQLFVRLMTAPTPGSKDPKMPLTTMGGTNLRK